MWQKIWLKLAPLLDLLQAEFWGNRIIDYLVVAALFLSGLLLVWILERLVLKRLRSWAQGKPSRVGDFLTAVTHNSLVPLLYLGIFYFSIHHLRLHATLNRGIYVAAVVMLTVIIVACLVRISSYLLHLHAGQPLIAQGIFTLVKTLIWGLGIIFLLDNLGFRVSAIIAGLGIGGIAVALASQTILGDLFNYFVILLDSPFKLGDFIMVGDVMGTVEYIGIKTTHLQSLSGEQLILPNTDLTNTRVRNFSRMSEQRIVFQLNLPYQTATEQLRAVPAIVTEIIRKIPDTRPGRVHFAAHGPSSLVFEIVYHVTSGDYNRYMDIQQEINFGIREEFLKRSIELAYPTNLVYVK